MVKKKLLCCMIACAFLMSACGNEVQGNTEWIPSGEIPEMSASVSVSAGETEAPSASQNTQTEKVDETYALEVHSVQDLTQALLNDDLETYADMIWDNQRMAGLYVSKLNEQNGKNVLTYYVSASEGDDTNDGLSLESPKQSLQSLSGISNIHVYLKTDDVFSMSNTFYVGDNVLLAAYGDGDRPELNFYQKLIGEWQKVDNYTNVWKLDLKEEPNAYKALNSVEDCNIGHLLIDGECNWKRKEKVEGDVFNYAEYLAGAKDNSWAVDWASGTLYLYSKGNPNQQEISYAHPGFAFSIGNVQNVCIAGIEVTGVSLHAVAMSNVKDVQITNCYFHHIGGGILKRTNTRYGNAVELWDSGENLNVSYNVAEWIYDTCYTAQGSAANTVQKNISFLNNVGSHSFAGIEIWGDGYAEKPFENICYNDNILLNACDVTVPDVLFYPNSKGQLIYTDAYAGYRSGSYPYHQMALLNTGTNRNKASLQMRGNLFWGSNRFLALFLKSDVENGYPDIKDNVFVEGANMNEECVYRFSNTLGTIFYLPDFPKEIVGEQVICKESNNGTEEGYIDYLEKAIERMANGNE